MDNQTTKGFGPFYSSELFPEGYPLIKDPGDTIESLLAEGFRMIRGPILDQQVLKNYRLGAVVSLLGKASKATLITSGGIMALGAGAVYAKKTINFFQKGFKKKEWDKSAFILDRDDKELLVGAALTAALPALLIGLVTGYSALGLSKDDGSLWDLIPTEEGMASSK